MSVQLYNDDFLNVKLDPVDLIITSPPYWNQKEYSFWPTYLGYMADVAKWIEACASLIKDGRYIFWVIPDKIPIGNKEDEMEFYPIYADTEYTASEFGLTCKHPIIWSKGHGTTKMFGSYPYPPTTIHTPMTERICVWRKKGSYESPSDEIKEASKYTKQEWVEWAQDVWEIRPETSVNHPAPFPVELPYRIIKLWSFVGDTVLDPFMGLGTTGVACVDRSFVGIEKNTEYFNRAKERIGLLHELPLL